MTQLLYRFPAKINLGTGQTMMVPFVDREVNAKRVWLYQPETAPRHPLAAVQLTNDGEAGLPAGIVTAYDAKKMEAPISSAMPSCRCCPRVRQNSSPSRSMPGRTSGIRTTGPNPRNSAGSSTEC
jgi:hypothetical protein